jgi:hypothetical protein
VSSTVDLQGKVKGGLETLVAFTKTFATNEFSTVYCEGEWRSVKPFRFRDDRVAMIVLLPKGIGKTKYYDEFLKSTVRKLRIPRRIPIVPWEELVEHGRGRFRPSWRCSRVLPSGCAHLIDTTSSFLQS